MTWTLWPSTAPKTWWTWSGTTRSPWTLTTSSTWCMKSLKVSSTCIQKVSSIVTWSHSIFLWMKTGTLKSVTLASLMFRLEKSTKITIWLSTSLQGTIELLNSILTMSQITPLLSTCGLWDVSLLNFSTKKSSLEPIPLMSTSSVLCKCLDYQNHTSKKRLEIKTFWNLWPKKK